MSSSRDELSTQDGSQPSSLSGKYASMLSAIAELSSTPVLPPSSPSHAGGLRTSSDELGESLRADAFSFSVASSSALRFEDQGGATADRPSRLDGASLPASVNGRYLFFYGSDKSLDGFRCCAKVGTSGRKWCFAVRCDISAHRESTKKAIIPNDALFIKEKESSWVAFREPLVLHPFQRFSELKVNQLLHAEEPRTVADWEVEFATLNNAAQTLDADEKVDVKPIADDELEKDRAIMKKIAGDYKTPKKGVLGKLDKNVPPEDSIADAVGLLGIELDKALVKLTHLGALVGKPGKGVNTASLFNELMELASSISNMSARMVTVEQKVTFLENPVNSSVSVSTYQYDQDHVFELLKALMERQKELQVGVGKLQSQLAAVERGQDRLRMQGKEFMQVVGRGSSNIEKIVKFARTDPDWTMPQKFKRSYDEVDTGDMTSGHDEKRLKRMEEEIEKLSRTVEKFTQKEDSQGVEIGGVPFGGEDDLDAWVDSYLPAELPFGCFVDVYSFMNRIQHSYQGISGLDNLVINAKLKLGNDEALA